MKASPGGAVECRRFSREQRLLRPEEFQRVFAEGCRTSLPGLTILSTPNGETGPRLGLAIARKHVRRAVDRNRIRRQVRESFRLNQHALGCRDYVVLARGGVEKLQPVDFRAELDRHWTAHIKRCARSSSP